jgi:hypothetical protein
MLPGALNGLKLVHDEDRFSLGGSDRGARHTKKIMAKQGGYVHRLRSVASMDGPQVCPRPQRI